MPHFQGSHNQTSGVVQLVHKLLSLLSGVFQYWPPAVKLLALFFIISLTAVIITVTQNVKAIASTVAEMMDAINTMKSIFTSRSGPA